MAMLLAACAQHSKDAIEKATLEVDPVAALEYLNDMQGDKKKDPDFYFQRAKVYHDLGQFQNANSDVRRAVELDKSFERAYLLKGRIEKQLGEPQKAIQSLLIAEKLGSRDEHLYRILASEYLQLGETSLAKAAVDRLIKLRKDGSSMMLQGDILLGIGDSVQAIKSYETAINLDSGQRAPYERLVDIFIHRSELDRAGSFINAYLDQVDFDVLMLTEKGRLLNQLSLYDSAIAVYHQIISRDSSDYMVYYALSNTFYKSNRHDSSLYYAKKVVELDSQFLEAKITMARALNAQRDFQEAIAVYQSILRQDSTYNIASEELADLQRKVAYLWQLEQRKKEKDSVSSNLPPTIEKKQIDN